MDFKKPPRFIRHPKLAWVEFGIAIALLILLMAAVRGAELRRNPELVRVGQVRHNLDPLPEPQAPVVTTNQQGEPVITQEISTFGWETYESEDYHFSFLYPDESWFIEEFRGYAVLVPPGDIGRIEINTIGVGRMSPLDSVGLEQPSEGIVSEGDTFAGRSSDQYRCIACRSNRYARHIRITDLRGTNWGASNEIWYDFSLKPGQDATLALSTVSLFDKILSTFEINQAFSSADWPRYGGPQLGFSVAYPPTWGFREAVIGEGTDLLVAFGPDIPALGRGVRIYGRGTADATLGARRVCGDSAYDLVRESGADERADAIISSFACQ